MNVTTAAPGALRYASPTRRRMRALRRYAAYAGSPRLRPKAVYLPTYFWDQDLNFGDQLTPALLGQFGIAAIHQPAYASALVGAGSIIEHLPVNYSGSVWGSGLMLNRSAQLPDADILAVRGPLTASLLGIPSETPTGDPGILIPSLASFPNRGGSAREIALIPHFRHAHDPLWGRISRSANGPVRVINVQASPKQVLRMIAKCTMVVSSSLHGLITADALGLPAAWTLPAPEGEGGAFKFLDYEANYGRRWERFVHPRATPQQFLKTAAPAGRQEVHSMQEALQNALLQAIPRWQNYRARPILGVRNQISKRTFGSRSNQWPSNLGQFATIPPAGEQ